MNNEQPPLVSGPEPTLVERLIGAMRALYRRGGHAPDASPQSAKRSNPPRPPRPLGQRGPGPATAYALGAKPWERMLAVIFIAPWTLFLIFPVAADYLGDPHAAIVGVVAAYPQTAALEPYAQALLWQSPKIAALTFAVRLFALGQARRNALNAGGWFVLAMLVDGAAWLIWGRSHMAAAGFDAALQKAASDLMIVFAIFSLTVWTIFGPAEKPRVGTTGFR